MIAAMDRRPVTASTAVPLGLAILFLAVAALGAVMLVGGFAAAFGIAGIVTVVAMCVGAIVAATVVVLRRTSSARP